MRKYKLILASSSPRRLELLKLLGLNFDIVIPNTEEILQKNLLPHEQCKRLAKLKAANVLSQIDDHDKDIIILAADTLVFYKKSILEKPKDDKDALKMLKMLSGKTHQVVTGLCFCIKKQNSIKYTLSHKMTNVQFHPIHKDLLSYYVSTGEGRDKAGSYGAQGLAQCFIKSIHGSHANVVGLPMDVVVQFFQRLSQKEGVFWKNLFI